MRLLLIDNLLFEGDRTAPVFDLQPHLGLMSLAAVAHGCGHEALIYDPKRELVDGRLSWASGLYGAMAEALLSSEPDVVGFTGLGCNFHFVARCAAELKARRPELPVLLGGPHATILHREILEGLPAFDLIVRHEAEALLGPVLQALGGGGFEGLAGVAWRTARGEVVCNPGKPMVEDLDALPVPAYDAYPLAALGLDSIRIEAGRGCPFSCTFCSTASFFGRNYRLKSPERLLSEMDQLHAAYGYADFKLNHDLFTVNRKRVAEFCEAVRGRGYTWACSARVDCVDEALLELMQAAGCRSIYFGIETGSVRLQKTSRKKLDLALVDPTLEVTARLGLKTTTSFITGYPDEEAEDEAATLDMAARLALHGRGLNDSQIHLLTPEPGTQLLAEHGDRLQLDRHVTGFNLPPLDEDDDALLRRLPAVFVNHRYFPTPLARERHVFVAAAWPELSTIGRELLAYALRPYGGRFSRLIDEAYADWRRAAPGASTVTPEHLTGFLGRRFGEGHHLVSLFRYAFAARGARAGCVGLAGRGPSHDGASPMAPLVLSAGARILREVHDAPELLGRIAGAGAYLLDEADAGGLVDLLLVHGEGGLRTFRIDAATADLLDRFAEPHSWWSACVEGSADGPLAAWADIERLCRLGVLVRAEDAAPAAAVA